MGAKKFCDKLGKILPGQMFPGKMSLWQLCIVKEKHGKLLLKFCQNLMSNSRDIADIEFPVVGGGWWVVGGGGGLQSFSCQTQLRLC